MEVVAKFADGAVKISNFGDIGMSNSFEKFPLKSAE